MKRFLKEHRGRLIWLAAVSALSLFFLLLRQDAALMTRTAEHFAKPIRHAVSRLSYCVPFSVMELLIAVGLAAALAYVGVTAARLIRKGEKRQRLALFLITVLAVYLTVYAASSWLWGVGYYAEGLQEKSGIYAEEVLPEELEAVTEYFARELSAAADGVARDETGAFSVLREEIFRESAAAYDSISPEIPALALEDRPPKAVRFSRVMSLLDLTGVYFAFTGEANVNVSSPACMLPCTIAHELAHQRGFASEKECNFAAILACTTAESPAYRYSGWLSGYIYLSNALYRSDPDAWQRIRDSLPDPVKTDLAANNAYWEPYRHNAFTDWYQNLYDKYLKGYGETAGTQSYGLVVELLTVYYRDRA